MGSPHGGRADRRERVLQVLDPLRHCQLLRDWSEQGLRICRGNERKSFPLIQIGSILVGQVGITALRVDHPIHQRGGSGDARDGGVEVVDDFCGVTDGEEVDRENVRQRAPNVFALPKTRGQSRRGIDLGGFAWIGRAVRSEPVVDESIGFVLAPRFGRQLNWLIAVNV